LKGWAIFALSLRDETSIPQHPVVTPERFKQITGAYGGLRVAVAGDFCLDRYLEIDPTKEEVSIETGLEVHNVVRVRSQPGGAGTVLNNLVALGVGCIVPIGIGGEDGEGYELRQALAAMRGVQMDQFIWTRERCTFTYCKPLVIEAGAPPRELNRLDQKNWTPTPKRISTRISESLLAVADKVDAIILLSQVDEPETGVLTSDVLKAVGQLASSHSRLPILADSRTGFVGFPPVILKMNEAELQKSAGTASVQSVERVASAARALAKRNGQPVFVTLAERGILGAAQDGATEHVASLPIRGPIDIVGAGDAVTANLTAALASGASMREALELANAAASIVIHQVGTTGVATVEELRGLTNRGVLNR
jgi:rfaE bifunctional protein kinase chain/domain